MALQEVYLNDYPLGRAGFWLEDPGTWGDTSTMDFPRGQVLWRAGELALSKKSMMDSRILTLTGGIKATTAAALAPAIHELKERCAHGAQEIVFADEPDKAVLGSLVEIRQLEGQGAFVNPWRRFQLQFRLLSPYRFSRQPTIVGFGFLAIPMPMGTAPVRPVLRLKGYPGVSLVNPGIIAMDSSGMTLATMNFTITLAAGDMLEVFCDTGVVQKITAAGVVSNQISTLSPASDFLTLSPVSGSYSDQAWPWLTVNGATVIGEAFYKRAWL